MYKRKDFKITTKELEGILGDELSEFKNIILSNCYCDSCKLEGVATIVNYEIFINYLNDTIFKGFCKNCNKPIARYTETGENKKMNKRINELVVSKNKKVSIWSRSRI